jgi:hypothetical protein
MDQRGTQGASEVRPFSAGARMLGEQPSQTLERFEESLFAGRMPLDVPVRDGDEITFG